MSTRQLCDNREEAFNHKTHNYISGQTQFNNEVSTSESSTLEDPQLPISPTNIRLGTPNKENKRMYNFGPRKIAEIKGIQQIEFTIPF